MFKLIQIGIRGRVGGVFGDRYVESNQDETIIYVDKKIFMDMQ